MKATQVYQQLEQDFITPDMRDDWAQYMDSVADFLCENFQNRSMGVVCDFTTEIQHVYTAVFPSPSVMQHVLDDGLSDGLLFVHHPSIWDIRNAPDVFQPMQRELLHRFIERRVSIYTLHVPLDHVGKHSTSVTFAQALGIHPEHAFAPYFGALAGVFGTTECGPVHELHKRFKGIVNHDVSLYQYGDTTIHEGTVAIIAGGGNTVEWLEEIFQAGVNTLVTGITVKNAYSSQAHVYAEQHGINVLGGTHYSTEKFACLSIVEYFRNMGLPAEFIDDTPIMEDL